MTQTKAQTKKEVKRRPPVKENEYVPYTRITDLVTKKAGEKEIAGTLSKADVQAIARIVQRATMDKIADTLEESAEKILDEFIV